MTPDLSADPDELGAASVDFLMYSGYVTLAHFWARMALEAQRQSDGAADAFLDGKLATARFYFSRILPRAEAQRRPERERTHQPTIAVVASGDRRRWSRVEWGFRRRGRRCGPVR